MEKYVSPKAEFVDFGNDKLTTTSDSGRCNCFAERWNFEEGNFDACNVITGDYVEVADANSGL